MPCFVNFFLVSAVQKILKSVKIWQSCSQMYTATFYEPRRKCTFWFFQVRCAHKSGNVINFIIVACRTSSRLKWCKNYKNRLRLAKVIVKNKMSLFMVQCVVGTVNNTEHKVTMKTSLIWTYRFSITLTSDLHDLTLSIIDLLTIRSPIWRYNYRNNLGKFLSVGLFLIIITPQENHGLKFLIFWPSTVSNHYVNMVSYWLDRRDKF